MERSELEQRIVRLAQHYKRASERYKAAYTRADGEPWEGNLRAAMEQRREALFRALEALEALESEEVELGEEVTRQTLQGGQAAGIVVSIRLNQQEAEQVQGRAEASGKTLSEVALQALRAGLETGEGAGE